MKDEWISVKDRLPKSTIRISGKKYLTYPLEVVSHFINHRFTNYNGSTGQMDDVYKVTHWMPFPSPPNQGH